MTMTMTNTDAIELLKELNAATKIFHAKNVELKKENSTLEKDCSTLKNELDYKVRILEKQIERNSKLQKSVEEKESIQKQKDLEYANSNKLSQNLLNHVKCANEEFEKVEASNAKSRKKSETEMTSVALDTKKLLEMLLQK
jgi:septal ring factor EnvC (AmiA/AmiB activator)